MDCCAFVNRVRSDGSVNWPRISRRNYPQKLAMRNDSHALTAEGLKKLSLSERTGTIHDQQNKRISCNQIFIFNFIIS